MSLTNKTQVTPGLARMTNVMSIFKILFSNSASPEPGGSVSATGGTITTYSSGGTTYRVHTFTSSNTFTVTSGGLVDVLCVGGGGGGSFDMNSYLGGGGGGGQVVYQTGVSVSSTSYPVTVGIGGYYGIRDGIDNTKEYDILLATSSSFNSIIALPGQNSSIDINAPDPAPGGASGSGQSGGNGAFVNPLLGGGGGGDSQAGQDSADGGGGGDGTSSSISGTLTYYGGGGGAMSLGFTSPPGGLGGGGYGMYYYGLGQIPEPNSGGGGGSSYTFHEDLSYSYGQSGADGIVIIIYPI